MNLSYKIPAICISLIVATGAVVSVVSLQNASESLKQAANEKLGTILTVRKQVLADYFNSIRGDLTALSSDYMTVEAIQRFTAAWEELGEKPSSYLQTAYIHENPHPLGSKEELDYAEDSSRYSFIHKKYHDWYRSFLRDNGYYDIFMFDTKGNLIYTVFKELDYATNFLSGEYKDTDLGRAYRAAISSEESKAQYFYDFQPYSPSHGAPASFIAQQVVDENNQVIGVFALQMPIDRINATVGSYVGLGETGEVFVVGEDLYMRNDARNAQETSILKKKVDSPATKRALSGETGSMDFTRGDGVDVFSSFAPFDFMGSRWAIIAWQSASEIMQPAKDLRASLFRANVYVVLACSVLSFLIFYFLMRPMQTIASQLRQLMKGDLNFEVTTANRSDEVGEFSKAIQQFKSIKLESSQRSLEMVNAFESRAGSVIDLLAQESEKLQGLSTGVFDRVMEASSFSEHTSSASKVTSRDVEEVSNSTQAMERAIREIAQQIEESNVAIQEAVQHGLSVDDAVKIMEKAAEEIASVVDTIRRIAAEIMVLSLNAAIESEQAGAAGRGFAVVASEVKNLANQATGATQEIAMQIAAVQEATKKAVGQVALVRESISKVSSYAGSIDCAVKQQAQLTSDITHSMASASESSSQIRNNAEQVYSSTSEAKGIASDMQGATTSLAEQANRLKSDVHSFLNEVRQG